MNKCKSCDCDIYIKDKIDNCSPGVYYKDEVYCSKCIEGIYFLEDINRDDTPIIKEHKGIKVTSTQILICPTCKISIEESNKQCPKCNKIHPLYIRKPKKKRNRKKK